MPSKDDHLQKARHNEAFFDSFELRSTPYLDWVVTGIFYAALHYVDAFLATQGVHPGSHSRRDAEVKLFLGAGFYLDDRALKDDSQDARYRAHRFSAEEVDNDIKPLFQKIKSEVLALLPS
jgi:uncharacterized protein (UPF0332 family)